VTKPKIDIARGMEAYAVEIIGKVKTAARARVRSIAASAPPGRQARRRHIHWISATEQIIAIGASTGGTRLSARCSVACRRMPQVS